MDEEMPNKNYVFDQVKEVDEETEREGSPTRTFDNSISVQNGRTISNLKAMIVSYYDTSDSEMSNENEKPLDQSQKGEHRSPNVKGKSSQANKSRLSQLSKFNLFALIELANACLIIKLQNDLNQALQICNEAIMTLKMLGEKVGASIVAQELLEMLVDQIMEQKTKELELDLDDKMTPAVPQKKPTLTPNQQNSDKERIPSEQIIAISESALNLLDIQEGKEAEEPEKEELNNLKPNKINLKKIMNSKDFQSVMAITTLVPFIKSGIPRLSEFDVKEAKL